jgi:hypothetical protein
LIGRGADLGQELAILGFVPKIAGTTQQKMVFDPPFEMTVGGLDITLFVRTRHIDRVRGDVEMAAELTITLVEVPRGFAAVEGMRRRAAVVGP